MKGDYKRNRKDHDGDCRQAVVFEWDSEGDQRVGSEDARETDNQGKEGRDPRSDPILSPREEAVTEREEEDHPEPCPEVGVRHAEVLEFQSLTPIPKPKADGDRVQREVNVQREQTVQHGTREIRQAASVRELHRGVEDAAPRDSDAQRDIEDHDEKLSILIRVQLTDRGEFERNAEEDACEQTKQIRRAVFPRVAEAERKLEIDDEFEKEEVEGGHGI